MDVTLYGSHSGTHYQVDLKKSGEDSTILTLIWHDRNECNDGEKQYSRSVVLKTSELRKLADIL